MRGGGASLDGGLERPERLERFGSKMFRSPRILKVEKSMRALLGDNGGGEVSRRDDLLERLESNDGAGAGSAAGAFVKAGAEAPAFVVGGDGAGTTTFVPPVNGAGMLGTVLVSPVGIEFVSVLGNTSATVTPMPLVTVMAAFVTASSALVRPATTSSNAAAKAKANGGTKLFRRAFCMSFNVPSA